jgi:hypothetical protein
MFIRFRQTPHRLQVSIVETRRVDGKVRHEHVASLGSIETPPTVADRVAFWQRINDRLAKLSNRVDMATQGKMRGDLHGRVPMVTPDEQRALQLENAEAEERFWSGLHDAHASTVADHKGLIATAAHAVSQGEAEATKAAARVATAKERAERIKAGENVAGGLGKPMTREDFEAMLLANGWTKRDIRRAGLLAAVGAYGDEAFKWLLRSTRATDCINPVIEREAKALLKLLSECDDPAAFAKQMLDAMPP